MDTNDTPEFATSRAQAYILFYTVFLNLLRWTIGFQLLKPSTPPTQTNEVEMRHQEQASLVQNAENQESEENVMQEKKETSSTSLFKRIKWKSLVSFLKGCINVPMIVALIAIFIGLIPPLKGLFFGPDAIFSNAFTSVLEDVADCTVPMTLLNLGAKLAKGPILHSSPDSISKKTYVGIIVLKLIVVPLIASSIIYTLKVNNVVGMQDPMLLLVLMLEAASPPALNLSIMTSMLGSQEQDMANLLFFSYLAGIITVTGNTIFFLSLIG